MEFDDFVARLDGVRHRPTGTSALCPAHGDRNPSLSVSVGREGGIVVHCHRGCEPKAITTAMGLTMGDLAPVPHVTAEYGYEDDDGNVVYTIRRWSPKRFQLLPQGVPQSMWRPLRAPALKRARETGETVWIFEGEKDCLRGASLGLCATCNPFGTDMWLEHYSPYVAGCPVVIVADNDPAGYKHARDVAKKVEPYAASVTLVRPRYGGDFSELLDQAWTLDALDPLPEEDELASVIAANVTMKPITWAWPGYVPFGKITMIDGDPGDGKSVLTVDLVARWTSGQAMPDGSTNGGPWPALMITAEDDPEDTIAPRLVTAGANLGLVRLVEHGTRPDRGFNILLDTAALTKIVIDSGIKIVVVDPIMAMLGEKTESNVDSSVRTGLYPLYRLARDSGAAILVVRHLNKGEGRKAIYRGGGSIAFIGAARAAYAVGRDPEDHERRIFACTKLNIAPMPPSLAYSILSGAKGPYLEWHGIVDVDAQDVLDGDVGPSAREIIQFLNSVVENGEPMSWAAIAEAGEKCGFTEKQLRSRRAQSKLVKIVGDAGRRSTRWGYREHLLAADSIGPEGANFPHKPHIPRAQGGGTAGKRVIRPSDPPTGQEVYGVYGGHKGSDGLMASDDPLTDEEAKDLALAALPLVCEICGAEGDEVFRWGFPFWVVRCVSHNPSTFRGGS